MGGKGQFIHAKPLRTTRAVLVCYKPTQPWGFALSKAYLDLNGGSQWEG